MVYKLLCEMGNRDNGLPWIRAGGVHSGLLGAWQADFSSCLIDSPLPLVHFHGLADPVVNVTGKPKGEPATNLEALFPKKNLTPEENKELQAPILNSEWKSVSASINAVADAMCGSTISTNSSNPRVSTTCHELCNGKVEYCLVEGLTHQYSGCRNSTFSDGTNNTMFDHNYATNVDATKYFGDFFSKMSSDDHYLLNR